MSLAGFKKQINKANQFVSEKIAGAKGTELDEEFAELERHTDVLSKLVVEMIGKTQEYLQPNPVSRAKMASRRTMSKLRGQKNELLYPQPEGVLGELMMQQGSELGTAQYSSCVREAGQAFKELAEVKYHLEDSVTHQFIEPLKKLEENDLKEIAHHRKKLSGRRLDYDCKKRKQLKGGSVTEEEIKLAESKFEESKTLTERAMHNLLTNDAEHIRQVVGLIDSCLEYHEASANVLRRAGASLRDSLEKAQQTAQPEHNPRPVSFRGRRSVSELSPGSSPAMSPAAPEQPCARALYDFDPENAGELGFKEGDRIELTSWIDENWLEGRLRGQAGFFPSNYVEVVVPL